MVIVVDRRVPIIVAVEVVPFALSAVVDSSRCALLVVTVEGVVLTLATVVDDDRRPLPSRQKFTMKFTTVRSHR